MGNWFLENEQSFRTLKIVRLAVIVGVVKASDKKHLKNAEKDVFYRALLDRITELYNADKNKQKAED